jgi:hypothetical protein
MTEIDTLAAAVRKRIEEKEAELGRELLTLLDDAGVGRYVRLALGAEVPAPPALPPASAPRKQAKKRRAKKKARKSKRPAKKKATQPKGSRADLAEWRRKLIAPVLAKSRGSAARTAAIQELAEQEHELLDGTRRTFSQSAIYLWLQQAEGR